VRTRLDLFRQPMSFTGNAAGKTPESFQTILDKWPDDGPSRAMEAAAKNMIMYLRVGAIVAALKPSLSC